MILIFFGSSEFSLKALEACLESPHDVALVITTPDQKRGRGMKLMPTVVKEFALSHGLEVVSPESLKDEALIESVKKIKPDVFVVSSYGKFIPSSWLAIPSKVSLNVHPSLLPKYRGASPINRPILNGDHKTGVSIMEVVNKLDAGDIFLQEEFILNDTVDALSLSEQLAQMSYPMMLEALKKVDAGTLTRQVQKEDESTYAEKLTKEEGEISFIRHDAQTIERKIRGLKPWPGTYAKVENEPLHLNEAVVKDDHVSEIPGTILDIMKDGSIDVATAKGVLNLIRVKPAGKKEMDAAAFINGRRLKRGDQI